MPSSPRPAPIHFRHPAGHRLRIRWRRVVGLGGLALALASSLALPILAPADGEPDARGALGRTADPEIASLTSQSNRTVAGSPTDAMSRSIVDAVASRPATTPLPAVPREHLLLRVVDDSTGLPVAGAAVAADTDRIEPIPAAEERRRRAITDPFERLQASGQSAQTDAQGFAVLRGSAWMEVMAQLGDLFASANIELEAVGPEGFQLRLRPQPFTEVRVVSQQRQPLAGVPLHMLAYYARPGAVDSARREHPIGCTDSQGILRVRMGYHLRQHDPLDRIEVFVAAPGLTTARARAEAGGAPIELVLPQYGSVDIPVVEADGRPLADDPSWSVTLATTGGAAEAPPPGDDTASGDSHEGAVRFPYVGLGLELQATASICGLDLEDALAGPLRQGERVIHRLTLGGSEHCTLQARLVDEQGQPWANTWFSAEQGNSTLWHSRTRTDDAGRLQMRIAVAPGATEALRLRCRDDHGPLGSSCEIYPTPGSHRDLGDLMLPRGESIARGTIHEERPAPPGLSLHVECLREDEWRPSTDYGVRQPDVTSFMIHRHPAASRGRLRLCVDAPGCEPIEPIEFGPGADLSIVLRPGLAFRARIQVRPELLQEIENENCYAVLSGELGDEHGTSGRVLGDEWHVECHGCRAGRYRLEILGSRTLATIDGIVLASGSPTDPRLDPWDLRDTIQLLQVLSVDANGGPVDHSSEVYLRDGGGTWNWCGWSEQGLARLVMPRQPMDLLVRFDQGGFATLSGAMDTVRVVVPSATTIAIVLEGMPELTDDAPIAIDLATDDSALHAFDMPDVQRVGQVAWIPQEHALSAQVFAPLRGAVRILRRGEGDTTEVLEQLPCSLSPGTERVAVTISASTRERLKPWAKAR